MSEQVGSTPTTPSNDQFATFNHNETTAEGIADLYAAAHAGCPVVRSEELGGFYFLTRFDDVRSAARDWETFSSASGIFYPPVPFRIAAIEFDPPDHQWWRGLYNEVSSVANFRAYEDRLEHHIDALIDEFAGRGHADLVQEYANVLPVLAICEIIGISDAATIGRVRDIGIALFDSFDDPERSSAEMARFSEFCLAQIEERRRAPRGDFLTRLGTQPVEGRMMTDAEISNLMIGFLVAGHHNTSSALASLLAHVTTRTELRDRLVVEPDLAPRAVEEGVRLDTPQGHFFRRTTREVTVSGTSIPPDSPVALSYAAANRDPERFPDPLSFRLDRERRTHLGFGNGVHTCPGAQLARLELRRALQRLLERLPDVQHTGTEWEYTWTGGSLKMLKTLPVAFTPEGGRS